MFQCDQDKVLKKNKLHLKVNHNSSSASPEDEFVIKMPQLMGNSVLFPNSLNLIYNYKLNAGEDETSVPDRLTSAIIKGFKMTISRRVVRDINNYNHLTIYRELWHSKQKYDKELHTEIFRALQLKRNGALLLMLPMTCWLLYMEKDIHFGYVRF